MRRVKIATEWKSVKDMLPPSDTRVVVAYMGSEPVHMMAMIHKDNWVDPSTKQRLVGPHNITHWHYPIPLPDKTHLNYVPSRRMTRSEALALDDDDDQYGADDVPTLIKNIAI